MFKQSFWSLLLVGLSSAFLTSGLQADPAAQGKAVFDKLCVECHGSTRLGGFGPPLIPQTLGRKGDDQLLATISKGLPNTQMKAYGPELKPQEIQDLVAYIKQPVPKIVWAEAEMAASRKTYPATERKVPADYDRSHITLVVERGTSSVAVFEGDQMKRLDQFVVGKIHGGPKFDEAFTRVFVVTRDGLVTSYNLEAGYPLVQTKLAVNTRNLSVSPDGKLVAVANNLPHNLVLLDGDLQPKKIMPLPGQPSGVYHLPGTQKMVLALRDLPKLYLIDETSLAVEEIDLPTPFEDFMFVPGRQQLFASSRKGEEIHLYDLPSKKVIKTLPVQGFPHLFSAAFFAKEGKVYVAMNHMRLPQLSILDLDNLKVVKEIKLKGSGYFVRTHPTSPYIWVDSNTEEIQLVKKSDFNLLDQTLHPAPGKKAMHIEFDRSGQQALISIWDQEGAVALYDSVTLKEIKRLPFNMPIGKYNAFNKTNDNL